MRLQTWLLSRLFIAIFSINIIAHSQAHASGSSANSSCQVYLSDCRRYPSFANKIIEDSWNGSAQSEAACWQRAMDYQQWCDNLNSDSSQSFFNSNGDRISQSTAPGDYILKIKEMFFLLPVMQKFPNVKNSLYQILPADWNGLVDRYQAGGAGQASPGARFGNNQQIVSNSAVYIVPPNNRSDFTKVSFPINLAAGTTWYLNFKIGLLDALSAGGPVTFKVIVSGDKLALGEKDWEVIHVETVSGSSNQQVSVPLGIWSMRSHFTVALQVQKTTDSAEQPMLVLDGLNIAPGLPRPELGMVRSNLVWDSTQIREQDIAGSASVGAKWFRDGFFAAASPADFVDIVSKAKSKGMKMLALVTADPSDYDAGWNAFVHKGSTFKSLCGWEAGVLPLSTINYEKFRSRLHAQFDAIKAANLTVDAFEIGNELDWVCFNGDIPLGQVPTEAQLVIAARAYAWFLHTAYTVIKDPRYFPNAKIITFGMANIPSSHVPHSHVLEPAAFVARLRNFEGYNYLNLVDGYGTHLYPDSTRLSDKNARSGQETLHRNVASLGSDKSWWITEWGYRTTLYNDSTRRAEAMAEFLAMTSSQYNLSLGPVFHYAYSSPSEVRNDGSGLQIFGLVNFWNQLLQEASVFWARYRF